MIFDVVFVFQIFLLQPFHDGIVWQVGLRRLYYATILKSMNVPHLGFSMYSIAWKSLYYERNLLLRQFKYICFLLLVLLFYMECWSVVKNVYLFNTRKVYTT